MLINANLKINHVKGFLKDHSTNPVEGTCCDQDHKIPYSLAGEQKQYCMFTVEKNAH